MLTIVDIVEQGRVPILFALQQMKNLNMRLDLHPDRVLITCEALGLHTVQATQAPSSHIVIDLASIVKAPVSASNYGNDDSPTCLAGDRELAFGTCPACVGRHRPHTYKESCRNTTSPLKAGAPSPQEKPTSGTTSPDRVPSSPDLAPKEARPGAVSSNVPRPPSLALPPGAGLDVSAPREWPEGYTLVKTDSPKDPPAVMPKLLARLRNPSELLTPSEALLHVSYSVQAPDIEFSFA